MKKENGFTLIELLIAMVIGAIVMAAAYSSFITQQKSYRMTESVSEIQQNLRSAMLFIERDLRMAGFNPRKEAIFGFQSPLAPNTFTITKDDIIENSIVDAGETVTYDLDSNTLRRDDGGGPQPIAENITNMTLKYYDWEGAEITIDDPVSVRSVLVTLTGSDKGEHTRELTTLVKCRNMGM